MYVGYLGSFLGVFAASAGPNDLPPLLMLTWVFDSAAMLAGTCLGRTKLSPASPNKSWEGVAGGTAAAAGLALALPQLGFWTDVSVAARLGGALVVGAAAVLGDLTESSLKRETGVKDSSTIRFLPDHGGVLDKMDALLFTAPALWYYLQAVR
jgi:phosphatidate cytidylyltransferase